MCPNTSICNRVESERFQSTILPGNFWYANKQYSNAISCWENSAQLDETFPTVFRNLALAYHNKQDNGSEKALPALQTAFSLDETDARVLMELDQLCKKLNKPHTKRLELLEKHIQLTEARDDLYLERIIYSIITLNNMKKRGH